LRRQSRIWQWGEGRRYGAGGSEGSPARGETISLFCWSGFGWFQLVSAYSLSQNTIQPAETSRLFHQPNQPDIREAHRAWAGFGSEGRAPASGLRARGECETGGDGCGCRTAGCAVRASVGGP
jgi:hypothetical protein